MALALELGLLSKEQLERASVEAASRGRPLERHLVEAGQLERDAARDVEVARTTLARACTACRKVTYLLPGGALSGTPCEHCGGALAPSSSDEHAGPKGAAAAKPGSSTAAAAAKPAPSARPVDPKGAPKADPRSGARAAPKATAPVSAPKAAAPGGAAKADPKSGPHAAPKAAAPGGAAKADPRSGPHAAPKAAVPGGAAKADPKSAARAAPKASAPATSPAEGAPALVDADEDWAPLPPWVGRCRIESLLAESDAVHVYVGRIGDAPVAVRSLKPEHVARRRAVDAFFRAAQTANGAGLAVLDLGADGAGVPFLAVRRALDDATLGERLRDLAPPAEGRAGDGHSKSDTGSLVFAKLQQQREELARSVAENSRRRERCVGRFVLLDELARDAGVQWRAFDTEKDELVVLRVLDAGAAHDGGKLVKSLAEVLAAAERLRSPQVASLRAHGVDGERLFLARAQTTGAPLTGGPTLDLVLKRVQEAAQALAYLHGQGLAHGGLHPGSILVDGSGRVTLVDVGLASALAAAGQADALPWRLARAGCTPLNGADAPPSEAGEALLGGSATEDVYALGAILYRAAAPFIPDAIVSPSAPPDRAADALAIALRCLSPAPATRYATMIDLARDLERVLEGQAPQARQVLAPTPEEKGATGSSVIGTLSGVFKRLLGRS